MNLWHVLSAVVFASVFMINHVLGESAGRKQFVFSPRDGATLVQPADVYRSDRGYGFEPANEGAPALKLLAGAVGSDDSFRFSVKLPDGNYRVSLVLGHPTEESIVSVKSESRRLMIDRLRIGAGQSAQAVFLVNVRTPKIADGSQVHLNDREHDSFTWDEKLTVEILGKNAALHQVDIEPAGDAATVYIAGDSTVTDQGAEPWAGWGQMLPGFFNATVAVSNHAESGRALYSFQREKRLDKILSSIHSGDYLFIQFGHNDQKDKSAGAGAFTTYKKNLEQYVQLTRDKGATPVLVTPMYRRRFDKQGNIENSLGDYPDAVRAVAAEKKVALIDLHEMSGRFFKALGADGSRRAFVHYPAGTFPGQKDVLKDDTHFNNYGAYELARCVVEAIRTSDLPLKKELRSDIGPFDPSRPDSFESIQIPQSPLRVSSKPAGN